ncbi:MAG: hypothetical protein AAF571_06825 [Verrucomicrobiota bacterium]
MSQAIPLVTCMFYGSEAGFRSAFQEMKWTLKQNPDFWKQVILYIDVEGSRRIEKYKSCFRQVVVDHDLPDYVAADKKWNCKGYWAKQAVETYGRVMQCDFDIWVRKPLDEAFWNALSFAPRFLDITTYTKGEKIVGCGCYVIDEKCDWDRFLPLMYEKWKHDELAWSEALSLDRETFLKSNMPLAPYLVDRSWLFDFPERRDEPYIVHGISGLDNGIGRLKTIGYDVKEEGFYASLPDWIRWESGKLYRKGKRLLKGLRL